MSKFIRVRVENGMLVGVAPPGLPEGTELDLQVADDGDDDMTEEELAELNEELEASHKQAVAGQGVDAKEVIRRLREQFSR